MRIDPYSIVRVCLLGLAAILVAACAAQVQTTSGRAYLEQYPPAPLFKADSEIDQRVREAAAIEPLLQFPARIGLARVDHGRLSPVPAEEMAAWTELAQRYQGRLGQFVQVSPFIAELMSQNAEVDPALPPRTQSLRDVVKTVRVTSARQHLDAVLVYEVYGKSDVESNVLMIADLSIIGAYIFPSREINAVGHAQALLIDVRNGYPYGTASVTVDDTAFATSASARSVRRTTDEATKTAAALELIGEIEPMIHRLEIELASKDPVAQAD